MSVSTSAGSSAHLQEEWALGDPKPNLPTPIPSCTSALDLGPLQDHLQSLLVAPELRHPPLPPPALRAGTLEEQTAAHEGVEALAQIALQV